LQRQEAIDWFINAAAHIHFAAHLNALLQHKRVFMRAFREAIRAGAVGACYYLMHECGVDPSVKNNSALQTACENDVLVSVAMLVNEPRVRASMTKKA
jgi:hypothetical protein